MRGSERAISTPSTWLRDPAVVQQGVEARPPSWEAYTA